MKKSIFVSILLVSFGALQLNAVAATDPCRDEAHYPLISKKDLASVVSTKSAFVVDVNGADSFAKLHVPTAVHYAANEKNFESMLPKDKNALIVAYCGGKMCDAWKKAAERACKAGYTNIKHYKDGIKGWAEGLPGANQ